MFALIIILFCISTSILFISVAVAAKQTNKYSDMAFVCGFYLICMAFALVFTTGSMAIDISKYNQLYTETKLMPPVSIDIAKYNNAKLELSKVEKMIANIVNKYQVQVEVKSLNGVNIYSMPMSANTTSFQGLGDIERGSGEKLKNLETLIEKQNQIVNLLINMANAQYKPEYYTKLQGLNVSRYSIFDGWFVRLFGMKDNDIIVVKNSVIYPVI